MLLQHLAGEHFEISSNESLNVYNALLNNINYPISVKANNYSIINFQLTQIYKLPLGSKNITYTNLVPGNYSMFVYFYFEDFLSFTRLDSNNIAFRIISNISSPGGSPGPLSPPITGNGTSSGSMMVYSLVGVFIITFLVTFAFIGGTEVGKFGFFSAIAPMYSKIRRKKDENYGYNRGLIQGYIDGNPGESYNAIKRALELKNGTLAYYLKILAKEGKIKAERDGMYKRFYPTAGKSRTENLIIELSKIQQKILEYIKTNPGTSQTNISKELGIIQSKLNYHISQMSDARLIKVEREGNTTRCFVLGEQN
jgi:hypothetical protein